MISYDCLSKNLLYFDSLEQYSTPMFIGIDIGGSSIKGAVISSEGDWLHFTSTATAKTKDVIVNDILSLMSILVKSQNAALADITATGIGSAGSLDRDAGTIISIPNIPALSDFPLASRISERTGSPVYLENDAKVAVEAEMWKGNGSRYSNWILLTLGTGIGGGAIIDGKLYTGQHGSAAEFGHTTIKFDGIQCPCGSTGCLEQYASAAAVVRMTREHLKLHPDSTLNTPAQSGKLDAEMIYKEAMRGDGCASEVMQMTGSYLGIGIANMVNIFNPEAVIIGGGLSGAYELLLPVIRETVHQRALPGMREDIDYHVISEPTKAPAFGAAHIAMKYTHNSK